MNSLSRVARYLLGAESRETKEGVPCRSLTPLDVRLLTAMADRVESGRKRAHSFTIFAMKFYKLETIFSNVRKEFDKYDKDTSNTIDLEELRHCFADLQIQCTEEELQEYFREADMDKSGAISFTEFILILAIVYLVGRSDKEDGSIMRLGNVRVDEAFEQIADAFLYFDKDGNGLLNREEVIAGFRTKQSFNDTIYTKSIVKRFDEMDQDSNGQISFREFLLAFVGWVGVGDEREEEDEDEDDGDY